MLIMRLFGGGDPPVRKEGFNDGSHAYLSSATLGLPHHKRTSTVLRHKLLWTKRPQI